MGEILIKVIEKYIFVWLNLGEKLQKTPILYGLVGGLGPKASSVFLKTLYDYPVRYSKEQELPRVILWSDPTVPDRTQLLMNNQEKELYDILCEKIDKLISFGANKIIILCFTYHIFISSLQEKYRNTVSIVDIGLREIINLQKNALLLCTKATYHFNIFQRSKEWSQAQQYILIPSLKDQEKIHEVINALKLGSNIEVSYHILVELSEKYQVDCFLAGCTEFHILSNELSLVNKSKKINFIDPLNILVKAMHDNIISNEEPMMVA
jgi:aspartate racemase